VSSSAARYFPGVLRGDPTVGPADRTFGQPAQPTDEALLLSTCRGDKEALGLLFQRHARLVRAVGYRILRDESEADDVLQEVFLFIHRKSDLFDPTKSSARSWIVQVAYHRAIDRRRYLDSRHFYSQVPFEEVVEHWGPAVSRGLDEGLTPAGAQKLFETLSENQRQTLNLFFLEGYTFDEIAAKLGQTRGNVKNHYFRGLEKLRKQIFERIPHCGSAV